MVARRRAGWIELQSCYRFRFIAASGLAASPSRVPMPTVEPSESDVSIRRLEEPDLPAADRIFRLAFGTFLRLPDPMNFHGDADLIRTRWLADPSAAFGAFLADKIVGSNVVTKWGSVGFFGPLTVHPELWERGIAKRLLEPAMDLFTKWDTTHEGLFTFAHSPKHIALYQKFGFAALSHGGDVKAGQPNRWSRVFQVLRSERQ